MRFYRLLRYDLRQGLQRRNYLSPAVPETVRVRVREAKEAIRNGASPFEGPVRDVSGSLRIAEGSVPDDATLRGMDWRVQGLEPLPLTPDGR